MARRGLLLRILMVVALFLTIVIVLLFTGVYWLQRSQAGQGFLIPLPRQVAAIVETIERTPRDELPTLLDALNSTRLTVSVEDAAPTSSGAESLPRIRKALVYYLNALGDRSVQVYLDMSGEETSPSVTLNSGEMRATSPIRFVVGLKNGRYLIVEAYGELYTRFTGMRLALGVLIVVLLVAGVTLIVVRQQVKPLEKLVQAVDRITIGPDDPPFPAGGPAEVRSLVAAMERMQARIQDLMSARSRLLAAIGHDLGTYLTRLRLRVEFIGDMEQHEKAVRDIDEMHALMTDALTLGRLDDGHGAFEPLDIAVLVQRHVESAASAGEPVKYLGRAGPVLVRGQESALARAVDNLIVNAVRYGGLAEVSILDNGGEVELRVDDHGPGIPSHKRDAVLEAFYRGDEARNLDKGSFGLGLTIVADIVRYHGGRLVLGDRPGGGLRASIYLPSNRRSEGESVSPIAG